MKKYLSIFKFELKSEINFKIDYIFSLVSYAVHIFVFYALWDYILQGKDILGYTRGALIWYIIVGEFMAYSIGKKNYIKVSDMIKNGDVANLMTKPISFIKYILAQEATCVVNLVINFIFGIILGIIMGGVLSVTPIQILLFLVSMGISVLIAIFIQVFIGMLAFVTEENKSFYLVISKAMLLLVFTPLEFFPSYVGNILRFLPTTYIVYPPGKILVDFSLASSLPLIIGQVISLIVVIIGVLILNRKGERNIYVNGG